MVNQCGWSGNVRPALRSSIGESVKRDFNQGFVNLMTGDLFMREDGHVLTLLWVILPLLINDLVSENPQMSRGANPPSTEEKTKRWLLAQKIRSGGVIEINEEDLSRMIRLVSTYPSGLMGPVTDYLNKDYVEKDAS